MPPLPLLPPVPLPPLPIPPNRPPNLTIPPCARPSLFHPRRDFKIFWDVRRGLIPIVGAARKPGTSMLLEDVACPVDK